MRPDFHRANGDARARGSGFEREALKLEHREGFALVKRQLFEGLRKVGSGPR